MRVRNISLKVKGYIYENTQETYIVKKIIVVHNLREQAVDDSSDLLFFSG